MELHFSPREPYRKFSYFSSLMVLAISACAASASAPITWKADGHVVSSSGKQLQLQLQVTGIYDELHYAGATYLAGFKIDAHGNNLPQLVQVGSDLAQINYWGFEKIPNDIFVYQLKVHMVDTEGSVYRLDNNTWQLTDLHFPAEAQVVYSDNNSQLIVCNPASPTKNTVRGSGCKSLSENWTLDFVLQEHTPKVCAGKLYVVASEKGIKQLRKVDITTGKIISSTQLTQVLNELCEQ